MTSYQRRKTHSVNVGGVMIGSEHPIVVQSMTNTDTADVAATVEQCAALARAGSELVRLTVNNDAAAKAVPEIVSRLRDMGLSTPIVGDFHYNGHKLLRDYPECAGALAKYRINPGNVSIGRADDDNFKAMIDVAIEHDKPVRIGVNWGSLDQKLLASMMDANVKAGNPQTPQQVMMDAMIESALSSAKIAEGFGLKADHILLSVKVSGVPDLLALYRKLATRCEYALHLGLTEAGIGNKGVVASALGVGILLEEGIGDTIRVSLTPTPGGDRCEEVYVAQQILQSLELRSFLPQVTSCPGCGRTTSTYFQKLAQEVQQYTRDMMPAWREKYSGVETLHLAVMGCIVNGPGESKHANIGISLPGSFEEPAAPVYVDGERLKTLRGDHIVDEFKQILDEYVASHYAKK